MAARDDSSRDGSGAAVLPLASASASATRGAPIVGWLVDWGAEEGPTVDWPGNAQGPVAARSTVAFDVAGARGAIDGRRGVVLLFERDREDLPIIIGLLQEGPTLEAILPTSLAVAELDGKRVRLEAAEEIVLRCGDASIVLRRNGRVLIRGTYVETRAAGTNRIKGGSVSIN